MTGHLRWGLRFPCTLPLDPPLKWVKRLYIEIMAGLDKYHMLESLKYIVNRPFYIYNYLKLRLKDLGSLLKVASFVGKLDIFHPLRDVNIYCIIVTVDLHCTGTCRKMRHRLGPQMMVRQVLIVRMTWMMMTLTLIKRPQSTWQVTGNKRETRIYTA